MKRGLAAIALSVIAPGALAAGPCPSWQPCNIQLVQPPNYDLFKPLDYGQAINQGTLNALHTLQALQIERQMQERPAPQPAPPVGTPSQDWVAGFRAGYIQALQADDVAYSQALNVMSRLSDALYHTHSLSQVQDIKLDTAKLLPSRTGNPRSDKLSDAVNALIDQRIAELSGPAHPAQK